MINVDGWTSAQLELLKKVSFYREQGYKNLEDIEKLECFHHRRLRKRLIWFFKWTKEGDIEGVDFNIGKIEVMG